MKYLIEVHAVGYDDLRLEVEVTSKQEAQRYVESAVDQWIAHNDLVESDRDLAFTRITKLSEQKAGAQ